MSNAQLDPEDYYAEYPEDRPAPGATLASYIEECRDAQQQTRPDNEQAEATEYLIEWICQDETLRGEALRTQAYQIYREAGLGEADSWNAADKFTRDADGL